MSAVWSDDQRRCLAALGYTLYRSASATAAMPGTDAVVPQPPAVALREAAESAQPAASIARNGASTPDDPLLRALVHAAGIDPAQVGDKSAWLRAQQVPSLMQLRNNPAAKRALWPRLRALRRERAPR